jgi:hypothetical protein
MKKRIGSAILAVAAAALLAGPGAPRALACEEEGPGLVEVQVRTTLSPEDAANIVVEKFDGTLSIKNIVLRGTARWGEEDSALSIEGPVVVTGVLLTTGDETTFLENRCILWLTYSFRDAADVEVGTATGFVTLEQVAERGGAASFQGTIPIDGTARQFAGTGSSEARGLIPAALLPALKAALAAGPGAGAAVGARCDEEELPGLSQEMEQTVVTGAKPGFAFEGSKNPAQVKKQFKRAQQDLTRQRDARLRVLKAVR